MKKTLLLCFFIVSFFNIKAQENDSTKFLDSSYTLIDDTLFTSTGFKIIVGQKLLIGKGSNENGWYESMSFKSAIAWPLMLYRDSELKNKYDTHSNSVDGSITRDRDKVKEYLHEGDSLLIKKIKRKKKKHSYWYAVYLRNTQFPPTNFICNIEEAIKTKEIVIQ